MQTIELTYPHSLTVNDLPQTVAAIGFFDGIHLGHQKVISHAVSEANKRNMESAVITFHPHPSVVLKKDVQHVQYITPLQEKRSILAKMDVDRLYIITFNKELSSLSPQQFIDDFIIGLNIKHLVAGFDYSFGFKGKGNMNNIAAYTRDAFTYTTISKVEMDDEKISSTKIRGLLKTGNVQAVRELLGRPLTVSGVVMQGAKRGKELGFPTANIHVNQNALLPAAGIYAVKVRHKQNYYDGMASLGFNPTFTEDRTNLSLEVNIFDYKNDLYGEELQVEWWKYIREEVKFDHVDALIDQMADDENVIRNYFAD
ncbi:bifunctional riboflavin kinase/FAD synthetase [Lentibacillus sp. N15]|uniref:bifunctional riboflavin kinase/FAD synthetase n=1 Tax=Lentibacillus songyuanensis TaxID=3136161 RepID=UPI0031BB5088